MITFGQSPQSHAVLPNNKSPGSIVHLEVLVAHSTHSYRMETVIKVHGILFPKMNFATYVNSLERIHLQLSIINAKLQIICKALARRLERIMMMFNYCIKHPDYTGFMKSRHSHNNTLTLPF